MRISKRVIRECADSIMSERGRFSQLEIHTAIETVLNRELTRAEKIRITQILRSMYSVKKIKVDSRSHRRVLYFT